MHHHPIKQEIDRYRQFVNHDLWFHDWRAGAPRQRWGWLSFRAVYIAIYKLLQINCMHQASTLTFITLMSLVPMLAFVFSLAKGFQLQDRLMTAISEYLHAMPKEIQSFVQKLFALVESTDFSVLGMIGLFLFFSTIVKVLGNIEHIFNTLWGVEDHRPWMRKLADYILVVIVAPLMIMFSSTLSATVSSYEVIFEMAGVGGGLSLIYRSALVATSVLGMVGAFTFIYAFVPNTKVKLAAALTGGAVVGVTWFIIQYCYIKFQIGVARYNAIYGIFATLPIFLSWLYINWMLILIGAAISFAVQNVATYVPGKILATVSTASRFKLAGIIVNAVCREFDKGEKVWQLTSFWENHRYPHRLLQEVAAQLCQKKVLIAIGEDGYVPALPPAHLGWDRVFQAIYGESRNGVIFSSDRAAPGTSPPSSDSGDSREGNAAPDHEERRFIESLAKLNLG